MNDSDLMLELLADRGLFQLAGVEPGDSGVFTARYAVKRPVDAGMIARLGAERGRYI